MPSTQPTSGKVAARPAHDAAADVTQSFVTIATIKPNDKPDFNSALNGFRGFCALLVFAFHTGTAGIVDPASLGHSVAFLWGSLRLGVEIFFMISGYVILGSLLRHRSVRGFLFDRWVRIYSVWLPVLVVLTLLYAGLRIKMFSHATAQEQLGLFVANLFLLPYLAPVPAIHWGSWSLTFEWVFYFAASLGVIALRGRAQPRMWLLGPWALACIGFIAAYPRAIFFLTGVCVFACADAFKRRRAWLGLPLVSLLVFLIAWRLTGADEAGSASTLYDLFRNGRWLFGLIAALAGLHMFGSVVHRRSKQFGFLQSRTFQFFGKVSYSFYLWHVLVMSSVKVPINAWVIPQVGRGAGFLAFCALCLGSSTLSAWASWRLFEVTLARAIHRLADGRLTQPDVAAALSNGSVVGSFVGDCDVIEDSARGS